MATHRRKHRLNLGEFEILDGSRARRFERNGEDAEAQQQDEGVPVARDGVRTSSSHARQMIGKETTEGAAQRIG